MTGYDGQKADTWSCGVVLFVLMYGQTPWDIARESSPEFRLYKHTEGYPCLEPWVNMNNVMRNVFHGVLAVHPSRRWTAQSLKGYLARELGWRTNSLPPRLPRGRPAARGGDAAAPG